MILNEKKLNRQRELFKAWLDNLVISPVRAGIIQAVTGFGKTYIAIMAIIDMNRRHPDRTAIVIVPRNKLKEDWEGWYEKNDDGTKRWVPGHIEKHNLINVRVFVVNTFVKYQDWRCDFLILDEAHHYANQDSVFFSTVVKITKYRFGMGLSATLSTKQIEFFNTLGWNLVGTVDDEEAEREGFVSNSTIYNLGIPLSLLDEEFNTNVNNKFNYYFKKFEFCFDLMNACNAGNTTIMFVKNKFITASKTGAEWRKWWSIKRGANNDPNHPYSIQNIAKYAAQGMHTVHERKTKWHNMPSKVPVVVKLIAKFSYLKTIVFCETTEMADNIKAALGNIARIYHTNMQTYWYNPTTKEKREATKDKEIEKRYKLEGFIKKGAKVQQKEAITQFETPGSGVNVLVTVRALDEGFDVAKIEFVLMVAYNSTTRQDIQRSGRGKRIDYTNLSKRTLIVNLYMIGTQEEKWLESKQSGKRVVRKVTSIEDISVNNIINLHDGEEGKNVTSKVASDGNNA